MYCPSCGAENDEGNRFCVACGSPLRSPGARAPAVSRWERLSATIGTTGRARLVTAATGLALVVAVVAFLALKPSDDGIAQDAYLRRLDRECTAEKVRVSRLETETLQRTPADFGEFASVLVTIAAEWHGAVSGSMPSPEHAAAVGGYETALLDLLMRSGSMARVSREGEGAEVVKQAAAVEAATAEVEAAIRRLGLTECSDLKVSPQAAA